MSTPSIEQLRDIHLPPAVSVWPLAPGWYGVGILAVLALAMLPFVYRYAKRRRRAALTELKRLQHRWQQEAVTAAVMSELSCLLRRVALTRYPQQSLAALKGTAWLMFLNKTGKTTAFTTPLGQQLLAAPYQRTSDIDVDAILTMATAWIKRQL